MLKKQELKTSPKKKSISGENLCTYLGASNCFSSKSLVSLGSFHSVLYCLNRPHVTFKQSSSKEQLRADPTMPDKKLMSPASLRISTVNWQVSQLSTTQCLGQVVHRIVGNIHLGSIAMQIIAGKHLIQVLSHIIASKQKHPCILPNSKCSLVVPTFYPILPQAVES